MIRKRKLITIGLISIITFIISVTYLFASLSQTTENLKIKTTEELIYKELVKLKEKHSNTIPVEDSELDIVINNLNTKTLEDNNFNELWKIANSWVSKSGIVDFHSSHLGNVLHALKTAKIVKADLDTRGTQLKLLLTLEVRI